MRSLAERARIALEWALRVVALVVLATLLVRTFAPARVGPRVRAISPSALLAGRDSTMPGDTLQLALAGAPLAAERDLMAALARAGRTVTWSDSGVPALAASVEPPRAPGAAPTLLASVSSAYDVALADSAGTLDSLRATGQGIALPVPGDGRLLLARAHGTVARAAIRESLAVRRVLVIGRAGWESKFTIAALEEAGWVVDADVAVAPGADVVQSPGASRDVRPVPDTARHAAVVLLDSSAALPAARAAAIVRFARAGGGVVLAGEAAASSAFAALRAGNAGARSAGEAGAIASASPRRGLPLRAIAPSPDAVVIERRGSAIAAAARRTGAGRVAQVGYDDTWRWRMEGDEGAPEAHRRWWSAVVASVARAPVVARLDSAWAPGALDAVPRAALVDAIGAASSNVQPPRLPARGLPLPDSLLLAAAFGALLAEWASRRLRGAR